MKKKSHSQKQEHTFDLALEALEKADDVRIATMIGAFSDLTDKMEQRFLTVWQGLTPAFQETFFHRLAFAAAEDNLLDFTVIAFHGLRSPQAGIRWVALRLLEDVRKSALLEEMIRLADADPDTAVREEAVKGLGRFLVDCDLSERHQKRAERIRTALEQLRTSDNETVALAAMESLAFVDPGSIDEQVRACLIGRHSREVCAGLRAIQNSLNRKWAADVLDNLDEDNPDIRLEAIRAAGQLQLKKALPSLQRLLVDFDELDDDTLEAVILAASQIGGSQVEKMMDLLSDALDDSDLADLFEEAQANLELAQFQATMAKDPELSAFFPQDIDEDADFADQEELDYIQQLRDKIDALPYRESEDDPDDDDDDDDDDEADDRDGYRKTKRRHNHLSFGKIEEIDWSRFRIIENPEDEEMDGFDDLDDLEALDSDDYR